jgi:hypothetical protein
MWCDVMCNLTELHRRFGWNFVFTITITSNLSFYLIFYPKRSTSLQCVIMPFHVACKKRILTVGEEIKSQTFRKMSDFKFSVRYLVNINVLVFRGVMSCTVVDRHTSFTETFYLFHKNGGRIIGRNVGTHLSDILEPHSLTRARSGVVVEALLFKQEGRGFHSRCCHWIFSLT